MNIVKIAWTAPARPLFRGGYAVGGGYVSACGAGTTKRIHIIYARSVSRMHTPSLSRHPSKEGTRGSGLKDKIGFILIKKLTIKE